MTSSLSTKHDLAEVTETRYLVGLGTLSVKTLRTQFNGKEHSIYNTLQEFPPKDTFILLTQNAENRKDAIREAHATLVTYILTGEAPVYLFHRNFGEPFSNKDKFVHAAPLLRAKQRPAELEKFVKKILTC